MAALALPIQNHPDATVIPINGDVASSDTEAQAQNIAAALTALINEPNIATRLTDDKLGEIARKVCDEYEIDDNSRSVWKERMQGAMDLAMLVSGPDKTYPFEKAANIKYPLLTTAALQFQARAYPAIVPGDRIVKCKVNGRDPNGTKAARGERVSEYTSWQLTDEMPEWEPDTDKLLVILPITGCVFRKKYWDPALGRQVSRLVTADRLVVNYRATSLDSAPRITEEMSLYPYEIRERILDGRFKEFEYGPSNANAKPDDKNEQDAADDDAPQLFLEQHRLLDLDGDGYPEPYIVTVHYGSQKVCRIVANFSEDTVRMDPGGSRVVAIRKRDFYVKYGFLPSPDGGFYELGFGWLLKDNNEAINSNLNMMLDAGHLANTQGGFISSALGIKEKSFRLKMGQWPVINTNGVPLSQAIYPITYPGPSETLFKLLGLLVEMGKEVASIKDVLSGETKTNMQPTTVLALIDQGMQFFTAIYKRIHRALKAELDIHQRLNHEHLSPEEYNSFFDDDQQYDPQADFADDMGISPVSDPSVSSKMQALARAEFIEGVWKNHPTILSEAEVVQRMLQAGAIEDSARLINQQPAVDPKMQAFIEAKQSMELLKDHATIGKLETEAILNIANAAGVEGDQALAFFESVVASLQTQHGMEMDHAQLSAGQGQLPAVAGAPDNTVGDGAAAGAPGAGNGAPEGAAVPPGGTAGQQPGNVAVPPA